MASASLKYSLRFLGPMAMDTRQRQNDESRAAAVRASTYFGVAVALFPLPPPRLRCAQRGARLVDERRKRRGIVDREVGENLSIDFDAGELEAVHERVVVHVVLVSTGVDAGDPETAEVTLLVLAIAVRVFPTAFDGLLGRPPQLAPRAERAAGGLHDLLLPLQARN